MMENTMKTDVWTNWSRTPKNQETSVGLVFKKDGKIASQSIGKVAIQFFKDSGTDAPEKNGSRKIYWSCLYRTKYDFSL